MMARELGLKVRPLHSPGAFDNDLVAFGLSLEAIKEAVSSLGRTYVIGHRVLSQRTTKEPTLVQVQIGDADYSISLSRKRGAAGTYFDPTADLVEDAHARDFTVNAMYFDLVENQFLDPLHGLKDLHDRRLELCYSEGLADDPVRLLRAMHFISRFGFTAGPKLLKYSQQSWALLSLVPIERFWPEWKKWALSPWPKFGLDFFQEGGLVNYWPDLGALRGSPQLFKFHPEGDVWAHTLLVVEALSELDLPLNNDRIMLTFAAFLHDIGKPLVTITNEYGQVLTKGHTQAGLPLARKFLSSIMAPTSMQKGILRLIERHMDLSFRELSSINLKVLAKRLAPFCNLEHFWALAQSDWNGRSPCPDRYPYSLEEFLEPVGGEKNPGPIPLEAEELMASLGLSGGPTVGRLMKLVTEAFDKRCVTTAEEALELAAAALVDPDFKLESFRV
jgi:tRNA nucleotidyltransferase (CCA-adding enzyme)